VSIGVSLILLCLSLTAPRITRACPPDSYPSQGDRVLTAKMGGARLFGDEACGRQDALRGGCPADLGEFEILQHSLELILDYDFSKGETVIRHWKN
jgi:hypothetical protein